MEENKRKKIREREETTKNRNLRKEKKERKRWETRKQRIKDGKREKGERESSNMTNRPLQTSPPTAWQTSDTAWQSVILVVITTDFQFRKDKKIENGKKKRIKLYYSWRHQRGKEAFRQMKNGVSSMKPNVGKRTQMICHSFPPFNCYGDIVRKILYIYIPAGENGEGIASEGNYLRSLKTIFRNATFSQCVHKRLDEWRNGVAFVIFFFFYAFFHFIRIFWKFPSKTPF